MNEDMPLPFDLPAGARKKVSAASMAAGADVPPNAADSPPRPVLPCLPKRPRACWCHGHGNAKVELVPVMSVADLEKGLSGVQNTIQRYG
jgi:hypothetical protein